MKSLKNHPFCLCHHLRDQNEDFQISTHFVGVSATFEKHTKGRSQVGKNGIMLEFFNLSTIHPLPIHPPPSTIHPPPFKNHLNLFSTAPPFNFSWAHLPFHLQRNNKILYFVFEYCDQIFFKSPWTVTWEFQAFSWFSPEITKKNS